MGRAITHMQIIKGNQKKKGFTTAIMMCCLSILVLSAIIIVAPSLSFQSQTNDGSKYSTTSSNQAAISYSQPNNTTTTTLGLSPSDNTIELKLLANSLSDSLNKSAAILELTSKLPEVKSAPYSNLINPKLHGIPKDVDVSKRKVAQSILSVDKDFRVIFFLMPNGDIYLNEPYLLQANLTNNNFAYRGYYKGAINTHNTYLGNVVISNSSGLPTAHISVPIYSSALTGNNDNNNDHNDTLVGIWAGSLNLKVLSKYLQSLNLAGNERILYVDQYGHKIADSDKMLANDYRESFANYQAFKNAIAGKSGSTMEIVNGTSKTIQYQPIRFHSTTWAVLLMKNDKQ
jgi:flagellar basal body-associated protein FliL